VETDVNRLATLMSGLAGFEGQPVYQPARPGEQHRSSVDPARAAEMLGWRPEVELAEGLGETIAHFRE
jgi:UDP-glucose 4-epimerase